MSIHDEPVFTAPIEHDVDEHTIQPSDDSYVPNPLFQNLVPETPQTRTLNGKLSFADAMPRLGYSSVFDIIRQPKQAFVRQVRSLSDADGEMAYDNALCYATQIARSYREEQVSSGRSLPQIAPQTGVRALVDVGPSYPNLFKENWDQFCKVGAIEAMDGPVAYLGSLRRFAEQRIEGASTSPKRIPLAVRRPDLDKLVIDEQSTYQSRPMLDLVNDVLTQGIGKYQADKGDVRPVHQLLAEKKHPFVFPYQFAHQQVSLALSGEKPRLGEINYRVSQDVPDFPEAVYGSDDALCLLSQISPAHQKLLLEPVHFPSFDIDLAEILAAGQPWVSPSYSEVIVWNTQATYVLLQPQPSVVDCVPAATTSAVAADGTDTLITVRLTGGAGEKIVKVRAYTHFFQRRPLLDRSINAPMTGSSAYARCLAVVMKPEDNPGVELSGDYSAALIFDVYGQRHKDQLLQRLEVNLHAADCQLSEQQKQHLLTHLGIPEHSNRHMSSAALNVFMAQTGLGAAEIKQALAVGLTAPQVSVNCPRLHYIITSANPANPAPKPMDAGARYVNGSGGLDDSLPTLNDIYTNSMCIERGAPSRIRNLSPDRLDRLQRMIRLQRLTHIPFPELDNLIVAGMRSEGDNIRLLLNANTLRLIGAYRHFNRTYDLTARELAALVCEVNPYAFDGKPPMFDQVFNTPTLFNAPLVLNETPLNLDSNEMSVKQTVQQLCAALALSGAGSLSCIIADASAYVSAPQLDLPFVSSLYRQARIAQMFALSVEDSQWLLELLGGSEFRQLVARGQMLSRTSAPGVDILDVLMRVDWAIRWLKANKLTVTALRELLDATGSVEPSAALLERLQQLAGDAFTQRITPEQVDDLGLPTTVDGTVINWYAQLRAFYLISSGGFIIAPDVTVQDTDHAQLVATVLGMLTVLPLAPEAVEPTTLRLSEWLADRLARQQRLVEGFVQEYTGLLPEQALLAARWAIVTPQAFLDCVNEAWPASGEPVQDRIDAVLQQLHGVTCAAVGVKWSQLGARALRMFLAEPTWLGTATLWPQTLHTLHLLKAYESLFNTLGQPEERLLGYLELANTAVSKRPGKRQLATQAEHCNAAAASLLGWNVDDVAALTATLPQGIAKTVAHLDWLRRAQAIALQTGLNGATLLQACALNADSPEADWQAVGQAAMAAVSA
ncbi:hypothetical protein LT40_04760 [Pseudomonas rhizosphaerae]|uniref:Toxin n=1 Tax=Pseudomonas rhizosphaerae TaxID=216142 RepID=A0A089YQU7_9PSED|nr:Tc toxin subunit A [Pseudomonas rhizosphaerae]AIS16762.1 hypothetical protein LT40_04760 [Pseudomonas rhizosphaerae]